MKKDAFHQKLASRLQWCKKNELKAVVIIPLSSTGFRHLFCLELNDTIELGTEIPTLDIVSIEDMEAFCEENELVLVGKITSPWFGSFWGTIFDNIRPYR